MTSILQVAVVMILTIRIFQNKQTNKQTKNLVSKSNLHVCFIRYSEFTLHWK